MSRFRTMAAVAILLFGRTFLWFMLSVVGTGASVDGAIWSVIQVLVVATVVGFVGATWGSVQGQGVVEARDDRGVDPRGPGGSRLARSAG
jgi:hypothetical protein